MRVRIGTLVIAAALVCGLMASMAGAEDGLLSTTSQSERTVTTTLYELTVHKSGRTDVTLRSGLKVFERAHPMMWLDGDKRPKPFDLDSRLSTREQVADRLGPGQGLLLRKKGCDWSLRTHTVQPFMTVQVSYTNPKKKPVRVKMLMPWCVGDFRGAGVTLGPGTADTRILENGRSVSGGSEWPDVTTNDTLSDWYMAAYNEDTGQTLLAGFLTHGSALTQVRMLHDEDREADKFPRFRAECVYDPPVELAPGETLVSEVFYVAVAERSPNTALERYGHAIAIANGIPVDHGVAPHGPTAQAGTAPPSEEGLRTSLDAMDTNLKRYGWTHFTIPAGWDAARGECLPDPARFPNGLKPLIDDIHSRGMTAGLALDPFVVSTGSQIAEQHPEWFVTPNDAGRAFVADDERILDVTAPGAFEYVQGVYERAAGEWGIDAVVGLVGLRALTMVEKYTDPEATPITAYRAALDAVRAGTSPRTFVTGVPPLALAAGFTQGAQWGRVTAPCWQSGRHDGVWGCVESVTNAARRYHFAPYVWTPEHGPAWFGRSDALDQWELPEAPPLTSGQSLAWLTVLAMSGSAITFGDSVDALTPDDLSVLRRLLPGPGVRARPLNVFSDDPPRVWSMPIDHDIGDWHVLALCNWGDKAQAVTVAFGELGLRPNRQYAIYDFWQDQYFGTAVDRLTISVPPGDVRVIGLRPTSKRPMFLSTDSHYTMGATDFTALTWDSSARTLTGTFDAVADTVYNLRVLVPPPYKVRQVTATCGTPEVEQAEAVLRIKVHAAQTGPVTWAAAF